MENRTDARDRLNALSTGTKILLPAAILLLIDLFLSWQKTCIDTPVGSVCGKASGWNGFWGVLLGLLTIALIVWVGLQIAGVDLSGANLPVTDSMITLALGVLVLAAAVIKLLTILGESSTIWSYIGVLLAAVAAYGAWQRSREVEESGPVTRARTSAAHAGTTSGTSVHDAPGSSVAGGGHTGHGMADDTHPQTSGSSSAGGMTGGMSGGTTGVPPATGPAPGSGMGADDELGAEPIDTDLPPRDRDDL